MFVRVSALGMKASFCFISWGQKAGFGSRDESLLLGSGLLSRLRTFGRFSMKPWFPSFGVSKLRLVWGLVRELVGLGDPEVI